PLVPKRARLLVALSLRRLLVRVSRPPPRREDGGTCLPHVLRRRLATERTAPATGLASLPSGASKRVLELDVRLSPQPRLQRRAARRPAPAALSRACRRARAAPPFAGRRSADPRRRLRRRRVPGGNAVARLVCGGARSERGCGCDCAGTRRSRKEGDVVGSPARSGVLRRD